MPLQIIAEYELVGRRSGGIPFPVRIEICKPVQSEQMAPAWCCAVTVAPLWSDSFDIYGDGSFQALCLGAKHAVQMLATFAEQEGSLEYADGESFDPTVFGFNLLGPEHIDRDA